MLIWILRGIVGSYMKVEHGSKTLVEAIYPRKQSPCRFIGLCQDAMVMIAVWSEDW